MVPHITTSISDSPLDVAALIGAAGSPEAGGIGVFVGTVRATPAQPETDRAVVRLEYEAHPTLADETLRALAHDAATKWDLIRVIAIHRTGSCELGEPTVVIACSAPHRAAALEACRWLIDELKTSLPVWKKEIYSDGSSWI